MFSAFSLAPPRPERVVARSHGAAGPPRRRRCCRGARRVPRRSGAPCRCRPAGPRRASGRHCAGVQHQALRAGAPHAQRGKIRPAAVGMCLLLCCGFGRAATRRIAASCCIPAAASVAAAAVRRAHSFAQPDARHGRQADGRGQEPAAGWGELAGARLPFCGRPAHRVRPRQGRLRLRRGRQQVRRLRRLLGARYLRPRQRRGASSPAPPRPIAACRARFRLIMPVFLPGLLPAAARSRCGARADAAALRR